MFSLVAPTAQDVRFASDLFGWDRPKKMAQSQGEWILDVVLPDDVRIEYQFVVDGKWMLDPNNPLFVDNGFGGKNSCYLGPAYEADVPDEVPEVPMRRQNIRVQGQHGSRVVTLYTPEGKHKNLPVLIYGDGKDYEAFVKPQYILQNLADQGKVPLVAVALIPPQNRIDEYWKKSEPYEHFVALDVLPALRQRAPISPSPRDVYVGGASLGGLISMRLAQRFPDLIQGGVHSQSGAFWASPAVFSRSALGKLHPDLKLFIEWGRYEGVLTVSNDRMIDALSKMFRPFGTKLTSEGHNWTAWRGRFAEGVEYLLNRTTSP